MHEHDHDIIMALAEGSLDPEAAARAEGDIAACDECRADLEMQRMALAALSDAPAVYLSASESAQLRDRLRRELRVAPAEPASARLRPVWGRWAALAAGTAAVFLAAFLILPGLLGGGDDADTVAFDQIADELAEGADERMATTAAASEPPSAAAPSDDAADMGMALEQAATTTTMAVAETTASPEFAEDGAMLAYFVEGDLTEELRLEIVDQLRLDADYFKVNAEEIAEASPGWQVCEPEVFGFDYRGLSYTAQLVGRIVDDLGQERLLVALVDKEDATDVTLASITTPECEIFATLP